MKTKFLVTHEQMQTQLLLELTASVKLLTDLLVDDKLKSLKGNEQTDYHNFVLKTYDKHFSELGQTGTSHSPYTSLNVIPGFEMILPKLTPMSEDE